MKPITISISIGRINTKLASSNSGLSCDDNACEAAPGDTLTLTATNLPASELIVQTYLNGGGASPVVDVMLGDVACKVCASCLTRTSVRCTVPVHSGRHVHLSLTVANQTSRRLIDFSFAN